MPMNQLGPRSTSLQSGLNPSFWPNGEDGPEVLRNFFSQPHSCLCFMFMPFLLFEQNKTKNTNKEIKTLLLSSLEYIYVPVSKFQQLNTR